MSHTHWLSDTVIDWVSDWQVTVCDTDSLTLAVTLSQSHSQSQSFTVSDSVSNKLQTKLKPKLKVKVKSLPTPVSGSGCQSHSHSQSLSQCQLLWSVFVCRHPFNDLYSVIVLTHSLTHSLPESVCIASVSATVHVNVWLPVPGSGTEWVAGRWCYLKVTQLVILNFTFSLHFRYLILKSELKVALILKFNVKNWF